MLFCNLGVYHDMIYILTELFNGKRRTQWIDVSDIPESTRVFFYKNANGRSFMQRILNESYEELLQGKGIEVIQNKIIDSNSIVKKIIEFYFGKDEPAHTLGNPRFIKEINKEIVNSKYPTEIKSSLYALFIEPFRTVNDLMRTFFELNMQLTKMYENRRSSISKVQREINDTELLKNLNVSDITTENTVCAVCLLDDECIEVFPFEDRFLLLLGENYYKNFELSDEIDLKAFGNILTEENRLKILKMMRLNGEITIKDIEQQLRLSGTNAYYHLSLMTKSGMVATRYEGRTVFYSINKTYINKVCSEMSKYNR